MGYEASKAHQCFGRIPPEFPKQGRRGTPVVSGEHFPGEVLFAVVLQQMLCLLPIIGGHLRLSQCIFGSTPSPECACGCSSHAYCTANDSTLHQSSGALVK